MSDERDDRNDVTPKEETPRAHVHTSEWSPWIWVVPVVALVLVGWLVIRYGFFGGADVTVRFSEARGLERYSPVKYRGAKVGTVERITVDPRKRQVLVQIRMDSSMSYALREQTKFWIVEPTLQGGGLGSLIAGTYVGIAPGDGKRLSEFEGQEYPPVLAAPEPGKTVILETPHIGAIAIGSPVMFEGMTVGRVLGSEYDPQHRETSIHAFVAKQYADFVRQGSRFWREGGLSISLTGGKISTGESSLSTILNPGISFYTPEILSGAPVAEGTHFDLYESKDEATAAADGPHLTYLTYLPGPVQGLSPGTPVQMKGIEVGFVRDVHLRYVPSSATLETPVTLEIDPRLLELDIPPPLTRQALRASMNDALAALVRKGMRATLSTSLILPGAGAVSLEMTARPGTGRLIVSHDPPIIPAAEGGNGLQGALASLNDIASRIKALPIEQIAGNLRSTTARVNQLVHDKRLEESLTNLNKAMSDVQKITSSASASAPQMISSLQSAATSAEEAAARLNQLIGSAPRQNYELGTLVEELTRAAESVRALAQYLTENPDSLLKGRRK
ncbi:MAG: MlaD family protein [Thermoanaerobaculia bacterium]